MGLTFEEKEKYIEIIKGFLLPKAKDLMQESITSLV